MPFVIKASFGVGLIDLRPFDTALPSGRRLRSNPWQGHGYHWQAELSSSAESGTPVCARLIKRLDQGLSAGSKISLISPPTSLEKRGKLNINLEL